MRARAPLGPLVLAIVAWPASGLSSQIPGSVGLGAEFQHFSFSDAPAVHMKSLSLVTLPFDAGLRIGQRVALQVSGFWARGERRNASGGTLTIQGPTDTQLSASLALDKGRISVSGILALPTGHAEQTLEEEDIAANIASDLLPFRISNWGSGGGVGLRAMAAERFGGLGAGVSLGYFLAQEFRPRTWQPTQYQPGNNLVVRTVLDGDVGRAGRASLQLSFHSYGDDLQNGTGFYRSGNRLQGIGSYAFAVGRRSSAMAYLGAMYRAEGQELQGLPPIGARTLFMAGGGGRIRVGRNLLLPTADLRVLRSEDGVDQGLNVRLGAAAELAVGSTLLVPFGRVHFGTLAVVKATEQSTYVGFDLGLGVRFGGAR